MNMSEFELTDFKGKRSNEELNFPQIDLVSLLGAPCDEDSDEMSLSFVINNTFERRIKSKRRHFDLDLMSSNKDEESIKDIIKI